MGLFLSLSLRTVGSLLPVHTIGKSGFASKQTLAMVLRYHYKDKLPFFNILSYEGLSGATVTVANQTRYPEARLNLRCLLCLRETKWLDSRTQLITVLLGTTFQPDWTVVARKYCCPRQDVNETGFQSVASRLVKVAQMQDVILKTWACLIFVV